jgi:hypothetical protein
MEEEAVIRSLAALAHSLRLQVFRRAPFDRMNDVLACLTANCCQGEACATEPASSCKC